MSEALREGTIAPTARAEGNGTRDRLGSMRTESAADARNAVSFRGHFPKPAHSLVSLDTLILERSRRLNDVPRWARAIHTKVNLFTPHLQRMAREAQADPESAELLAKHQREIGELFNQHLLMMDSTSRATHALTMATDVQSSAAILEAMEHDAADRQSKVRRHFRSSREVLDIERDGLLYPNVGRILVSHFDDHPKPRDERLLLDIEAYDGGMSVYLEEICGLASMTNTTDRGDLGIQLLENDQRTYSPDTSMESLLTDPVAQELNPDAIVFSHAYRLSPNGVSLEVAKWAHSVLAPGGICVIPYQDIVRSFPSRAELSRYLNIDVPDPEQIRLALEADGIQVRVMRPTMRVAANGGESWQAMEQFLAYLFSAKMNPDRARITQYYQQMRTAQKNLEHPLYLMAIYKDAAPPQPSWYTGQRLMATNSAALTDASRRGLLPPKNGAAHSHESFEFKKVKLGAMSPQEVLDLLEQIGRHSEGGSNEPKLMQALAASGISRGEYNRYLSDMARIQRQCAAGANRVTFPETTTKKKKKAVQVEPTQRRSRGFDPDAPVARATRSHVDDEEEEEFDETDVDDTSFETMGEGTGRGGPGRPKGSGKKSSEDAESDAAKPIGHVSDAGLARLLAAAAATRISAESAEDAVDSPISSATLERIATLEKEIHDFGEKLRATHASLHETA